LEKNKNNYFLKGLFFKKDKSEKSKHHSSLKRAKSGIQLERKKTTPQNASASENKPADNSTPNNDLESKNK
jgi:hypothetical protein